MLRVIKEFKPRWIVGENVGGLINQSHMEQPDSEPEVDGETDNEECCDEDATAGGVLYEIIDNLEQIGYSVQTFVIPACAVNAPHRRDRIWIVAHSTSDRCDLRKCDRKRRQVQDPAEWEVAEDKQERNGWVNRIGKTHDVSSDTRRKYGERTTVNGEPETAVSCEEATVMPKRPTCDDGEGIDSDTDPRRQAKQEQQATGDKQCGGDDTDTDNKGLERMPKARNIERSRKASEQRFGVNFSWEQNWLEVATELCRVDDGLPIELDGFKLSKAGHRVERLKALGNAIVPQVAVEIFKAIKMAENT